MQNMKDWMFVKGIKSFNLWLKVIWVNFVQCLSIYIKLASTVYLGQKKWKRLFLKFLSIQSKIIHSIFIYNNYFATHFCQQPLFSEKLQTFFCLSLSLDTNWQLRNKEQHSAKTIQSQSGVLKSRPCENSLADFCTSACLKAKLTWFTLKK